ncbi:MAG: sigma-70 family RNA polymerase sigma factor [Opitutae bacterium]|nr:sigma-70 family RNA polymerase sigma factor [Opitutae bacterium]
MTASAQESLFRAWLAAHAAIPRKISRVYAPGDHDDLHQAMLVQLWRSLPRFNGQCAATTWIYRVCLNTALTWRRDEARRTRWLASEPASDVPATAPDGENTERIARLYAAIHQLAAADRTLVLLLLDQLPYSEIAEITGLTPNAVGARLTRARARLAQLIEQIP